MLIWAAPGSKLIGNLYVGMNLGSSIVDPIHILAWRQSLSYRNAHGVLLNHFCWLVNQERVFSPFYDYGQLGHEIKFIWYIYNNAANFLKANYFVSLL